MFLNALNPLEKNSFMKLAVLIIKADGVIEESEKRILSVYANEMRIPVCDFDEHDDTDKIVEKLKMNSTVQAKRIVFLELLALALADGYYGTEEKALLQQLADAFEFEKTFIEQAINLEDAYMSTYISLVNLIEKGE